MGIGEVLFLTLSVSRGQRSVEDHPSQLKRFGGGIILTELDFG